MDRKIVYPGQIPLDTDSLTQGRFDKIALGRLMDQLYGGPGAGINSAFGFGTTLSSSALTLTIGEGTILTGGVSDNTAIGGQGGGLSADPTTLTVQYINPTAQTITLPGTGATYTVYAMCVDSDDTNTVLPFYNSTNPSMTQAGANNSGQGLPTRRTSGMTFVAATSAPTAPAGGAAVPIFTIVVPSGATNSSGCTVALVANTFWPTIPTLTHGRLLNIQGWYGSAGSSQSFVYTPTLWTTNIFIEAVGGGGSGGSAGICSSASQIAVSSGANSGSWMTGWVLGAANIAALAGAQGSAGAGALPQSAGGNPGLDGGASSLGSLFSVSGGRAGLAGTSQTPPYLNYNGSLNGSNTISQKITAPVSSLGAVGSPGIVLSASAAVSGTGAASPWGAGGSFGVVGGSAAGALGPGAGGSGVVNTSQSSGAQGGQGGPGFIRIWEFS